ncbi:hypothetical protein THOG05_60143 [Vibrio rotiferianus]|nr:hypothetical protein THOG05_60143 [Vibrio rotiferianus]CAH1564634.1 hypothetical protein THOE12_20721 [Vibrio rotiferianus]
MLLSQVDERQKKEHNQLCSFAFTREIGVITGSLNFRVNLPHNCSDKSLCWCHQLY